MSVSTYNSRVLLPLYPTPHPTSFDRQGAGVHADAADARHPGEARHGAGGLPLRLPSTAALPGLAACRAGSWTTARPSDSRPSTPCQQRLLQPPSHRPPLQGYSYHRMDGGTSVAQRARLMDDFNNNPDGGRAARGRQPGTPREVAYSAVPLALRHAAPPAAPHSRAHAHLAAWLGVSAPCCRARQHFAAIQPATSRRLPSPPCRSVLLPADHARGGAGRQPDGRQPSAALRPRLEPLHRRAGRQGAGQRGTPRSLLPRAGACPLKRVH